MKKQVRLTIVLITILIVAAILILNFMEEKELDGGVEEGCGQGTVIYKDPNLCWQKSVASERAENWADASVYCDNLELAGDDDWRLPTADELNSIVEKANLGLVINANFFTNTENVQYWTSSVYANSPDMHWYVDFNNGYQGFAKDFREDFGIRCIRDKTLF